MQRALSGDHSSATPRDVEIGTVSLPANNRCVRVCEFIDRCTSTATDVHSCPVQVTNWYPEYIADYFQHLINVFGPEFTLIYIYL